MTPRRRLTWRDAETAAAALTPVERRLLDLLARLPLAAVDILSRLTGLAGSSAAYRHLDRLRAAGLADTIRAPLGPRLSPGLWHPTDLGLAVLAIEQGGDPATLARAYRLRRRDLLARLRRLPSLLALHRLLGALAAAEEGTPRLLAWETPWHRSYRRIDTDARIALRLPARVALAWGVAENAVRAEYLLLPDLATAPLAARRDAIDRLFPARTALERAGMSPPTLLVATDARRADAWAALLEALQSARRDAPLPARIVTWDDLDADVRSAVANGCGGRPASLPARPSAPSPILARPPDTPIPRLAGRNLQRATVPALFLRPGEWALLDLLARHPLLTRDLAARALGWGDETLRRRRSSLIARGLARLIPPGELSGKREADPALHRLAAREPTEATAVGLRALAAWQGLTLGAAVRCNGLAGGGPDAPVGTRASLLAAPLHTLGVEALFADLAGRARRAARRGADEGLVEWRNAAACAREWFRPDGYVVYWRGDGQHAAFVEYDRGTMGPRDWSQKLGAYFTYRDGGDYRRDYVGFPALLIVVAADGAKDVAASEAATEGAIADALRALAVGRSPLPALLTSATRLAVDPAGPLGPVWREADTAHRRPWLRFGRMPVPSGRRPTPSPTRATHRVPGDREVEDEVTVAPRAPPGAADARCVMRP